MTTSFRVAPPSWENDKSLVVWKSELDLWKMVTDLTEQKQGPAIVLTLTGRKREVAMELSAEKLSAEDGLNKVLNVHSKAFAKEKCDALYEVYETFESIQRGDKDMTSFIDEFEKAISKIKNLEWSYQTVFWGVNCFIRQAWRQARSV